MTSSKRYKIRGSAVAVLVILAFGVTALNLQAYEPCQRFVQKYVEKYVPRHYGKATLARWAEWGKAHPDYHPPKRRPRMQRKEVLEKVSFDCAIPVQYDQIADLLSPEPLDDQLPLIPMQVALNTTPPITPRPVSLVSVPVDAPLPISAETPELPSWLLAMTGMLIVFGFSRRPVNRNAGSAISGF